MEVVLEMDESHMTQLNMLTGHKIKLRKFIERQTAALAPGTNVPVHGRGPINVAATQPPAALQHQAQQERRTAACSTDTGVSNPRADGGADKNKKKSPTHAPTAVRKVSFGGTETTSQTSLLDGQYDEQAAAASFQEAVMSWRLNNSSNCSVSSAGAGGDSSPGTSGGPAPNKAASPGKMKITSPGARKLSEDCSDEKKSFSLSGLGAGDLSFSLPPANQVTSVLSSSPLKSTTSPSKNFGANDQPLSKTTSRSCCYVCYSQFVSTAGVKLANGQEACSDACAVSFLQNEQRRKEIAKRRQTQIAEIQTRMELKEQQQKQGGPSVLLQQGGGEVLVQGPGRNVVEGTAGASSQVAQGDHGGVRKEETGREVEGAAVEPPPSASPNVEMEARSGEAEGGGLQREVEVEGETRSGEAEGGGLQREVEQQSSQLEAVQDTFVLPQRAESSGCADSSTTSKGGNEESSSSGPERGLRLEAGVSSGVGAGGTSITTGATDDYVAPDIFSPGRGTSDIATTRAATEPPKNGVFNDSFLRRSTETIRDPPREEVLNVRARNFIPRLHFTPPRITQRG